MGLGWGWGGVWLGWVGAKWRSSVGRCGTSSGVWGGPGRVGAGHSVRVAQPLEKLADDLLNFLRHLILLPLHLRLFLRLRNLPCDALCGKLLQ